MSRQTPISTLQRFHPGAFNPLENAEPISSAYKKPPAAQRGKCVVCGKPALETLKLTMLDIVIIPSVNVQDKSFVSDPQLHIFYDTAVTAMDDNLPKYSGYLKSQLAFSYQLIKSLVRKA